MQESFRILEHPADLGIEAFGNSMQELFSNSTKGLMYVIAGNSNIEPLEKKEVGVKANDRENLLVRWLNEILFFFDTKKFLISNVEYKVINDFILDAIIHGEKYDSTKHQLNLYVKAVTYHKLKIDVIGGIWKAQFFLDV